MAIFIKNIKQNGFALVHSVKIRYLIEEFRMRLGNVSSSLDSHNRFIVNKSILFVCLQILFYFRTRRAYNVYVD